MPQTDAERAETAPRPSAGVTPAGGPARRPSRRDVLGAGVGLLAAAGLTGRARGAGTRTASENAGASTGTSGKAKNVIFLVVDGMSIGTFTIADMVARQRGGDGSHWASLWNRPGVRRSMMSTRAADSLVTDSAAGGSAWGCGHRLYNGSICFSKEEGELTPILVKAKRAGKSTGLVSTARITHATPASFVATVPNRNMERIIAEQELERGVDLLLGGGAKFFGDELLAKHPDLTVVRDAAGLRYAKDAEGRLLGLFTDDHMSYELDRQENEPHIEEMAMLAIDRLSQNPEGFVLQVEGGRVDHGGHSNDFPAMLHDMLAFEKMVGSVCDWAMDRGDTLVIITTDHGNSGPELTVYKEQSYRAMETLLGCGHTLTWMLGQVQGRPRAEWPAAFAAQLKEHAGVTLSEEELDWAFRPLRGERADAFGEANTLVGAIGSVMANHFGVGFVSDNHTAEHVEATAFGPGSAALPYRIENYELHALMADALGVPAT